MSGSDDGPRKPARGRTHRTRLAEMAEPGATVEQLGEGWLAVTKPGTGTFYVHEPTNQTTWERPQLAADRAAQDLALALRARYSLADGAGVGAAAQALVRGGVKSIEHFEQAVGVDQLGQLPFKKGDVLKIKLKREQAAAEAAAAAPALRIETIGSITLSVKGFDIAATWTQAVVNAANQQSFTQGDSGVSGVLRNACSEVGQAGDYRDVCYQPKTWLVGGADAVAEQTGEEVAETQVGSQPAGGRLRRCGVEWVLHAVGPRWTQYTEAECQNPQSPQFRHIETMIRDTVGRALSLAAHRGCRSVTIPAISGGIFCHSGWGGPAALQELEQFAAREALVAACVLWMRAAQRGVGPHRTLQEIVLVDHPDESIGRLDLMQRAFDKCLAPAAASRMAKVVCVGDLHGHIDKTLKLWSALQAELGKAALAAAHVVFLGDYCDRGPHTREVLDFLIHLERSRAPGTTTFLAGNHDFAFGCFLGCLDVPTGFDLDGTKDPKWTSGYWTPAVEGGMHYQGRRWGGDEHTDIYDARATFASYGVTYAVANESREALIRAVPEAHKQFLRRLAWVHDAPVDFAPGRLICVHAGLYTKGPLEEQLAALHSKRLDAEALQVGGYGRFEAFSGRREVEQMHPELEGKALLVSGHHGFTRQNADRWIVDTSGGKPGNQYPIEAVVFPSRHLISSAASSAVLSLQLADGTPATEWQPSSAHVPARTMAPAPEPQADVTMLSVTADFAARQATELTVKMGELVVSGLGSEFEAGEWRRVWRPGAEHVLGWVPMQHLQPLGTMNSSAGGALHEGVPQPRSVGSGGGLGFNQAPSTPSPRPPGVGGINSATASSPAPATLKERLISYGIPESQATGYAAALTQCAAEGRPPAAYAQSASPHGAMELFDACTLEELKRDIGVKNGHLKQIAKLSPSPRHR